MSPRVAVLGLVLVGLALGACQREQKAVEQDLPAARTLEVRANAQQIASAVRLYQTTFGMLPDSLDALTQSQTISGVTGGPFLASVPAPPAPWSPYEYARQDDARFTITSSAAGKTITAP